MSLALGRVPRLCTGHYFPLGEHSGDPACSCSVIFCRSLVAGTEVYESAPCFSAANFGVSVENWPLWTTSVVLQKRGSTEICAKTSRDFTPHSQAIRVFQVRILVPNLNRHSLSHLLLQRTGLPALCQCKQKANSSTNFLY